MTSAGIAVFDPPPVATGARYAATAASTPAAPPLESSAAQQT